MIVPRPILRRPRSRDRRGTVLVGLLVGLMLLASALIAVAISGRREQDLTMRRMEAMRAAYAEEAAAQIAVRELVNQQDDDGDGIVGEVAAGVLASGITIGSSKASASADASGTVWTVQPQGSNGVATKGCSLAVSVTNYVPGLYVEGFTLGASPANVAAVNWAATPTVVAIVPYVDTTAVSWLGGPASNYALRYRGIITMPAAGTWTFSTTSDDGSVLWINGVKVVDNDGVHNDATQSGSIDLPAGAAFFDLKFFHVSGGPTLSVSWQGPTVPTSTVIPATAFTCDPVLTVPPIVGNTALTLAGAALDGYNSKSGAYGGSNITSAFSVQANGTAANAVRVTFGTLAANALCGVGGTPATAITTGSGGSISGTQTAATSGIGLFYHTLPLASLASSGALSVTGTTTISADTRYSSITANTANARIVISGHRIVRVDGNVTIGNNCTLEIGPNSSLLLCLNMGHLYLQDTSQVNANTADPTRMRVVFSGTPNSMYLAQSAAFHGYVFNPGGNLQLDGGSTPAPTFFGAFHGRNVITNSTALVRADAAFGSTTSSTNVLTGWRQTQ